MGTNTNRNENRRPRRRRRQGVSVMLTIVMLIIALLMGGMAGFVIARRTDPSVHALQAANDRITELENTLTLIGFDEGTDNPSAWISDADAPGDGLDGLTEPAAEPDADDLWSDDGLLSGMLVDSGEPVVVAEYDGGQLLSSEFIPEYNDALTDAVFSGQSAQQTGEELMLSVMSDMIGDRLAAAKAEELGLNAPGADDLAAISAQAAEIFDARLADYLALNQDEEASPEEARAAAEKAMAADAGVTLESITEGLKQSWWKQKYYEYVVRNVTVTDEEVKTRYAELLASQKASFSAEPEACEYEHNEGNVVVYRPQIYRAVRDVLIPFTDQERSAALALMNQVEMGVTDDAWREQVDALYAPLEARAAQAQEKLAAGADFESLMVEYGCSDFFRTNPLRSEGLYISDDTYVISQEFVEAAMLLESPGQVSSPVRSYSGVHLVQYIGDAAAGEVPLADVEAAVQADALKRKQGIYYDQQRQAMLEAANVKYYPERLH